MAAALIALGCGGSIDGSDEQGRLTVALSVPWDGSASAPFAVAPNGSFLHGLRVGDAPDEEVSYSVASEGDSIFLPGEPAASLAAGETLQPQLRWLDGDRKSGISKSSSELVLADVDNIAGSRLIVDRLEYGTEGTMHWVNVSATWEILVSNQ